MTLTACEATPPEQPAIEAIENLNEAMEKANKTIQKQKTVLDSTMGIKEASEGFEKYNFLLRHCPKLGLLSSFILHFFFVNLF